MLKINVEIYSLDKENFTIGVNYQTDGDVGKIEQYIGSRISDKIDEGIKQIRSEVEMSRALASVQEFFNKERERGNDGRKSN